MDSSPVFLIGFMASGKSTVGRLAAGRMGRAFVDLDVEIERARGRSVASIFRDEGEAGFRRAESAALGEIAGRGDVLVACGGGAPASGDNLGRMRRAGLVVGLRASLAEVQKRLAASDGEEGRPLAAPETLGVLFAARETVYAAADLTVDTDGRVPEDVADEVARRAALRLGDVHLRTAAGSHPIRLAPLSEAGRLAAEVWVPKPSKVAVVSDTNVAAAGHVAATRAALEGAGLTVAEVVVPAGEQSKTLAVAGQVASACVAAGLDRRSAVVAVGGGVVGDLAGFVASMLFRGVPVAQVPTTLLAMVDSSIGGKTGVDLPEGKNLVGAFWQPSFVLADTATLATLPVREHRAALGEVLKYGLLYDEALFDEVAGGRADTREVVLRCARFKARVVAEDERELTGARANLNLGHTVGHAIEAASEYRLLHGEAIGLGLRAAARVSVRLGFAPAELEGRVTDALLAVGLDADLEPWLRPEVLARVGVDKKRAGRAVRFIALDGVGRPRQVDVTVEELAKILRPSETR